MKSMPVTLIVCTLILVIIFYVFGYGRYSARGKEFQVPYSQREIVLGNSTFTLLVADTQLLQQRGLSYRGSLAPQTGMLFVFETPGVYKFWMKDMNFPIDIIWLDENKKVVHIEHSLSPSTYPQSFGPSTPTQYVIEIPTGRAKEIGLSVGGDTVKF